MFKRHKKQRTAQDAVTQHLRDENKAIRKELEAARAEAKAHQDRAERFANDRIKAAAADAREMAELREVAEAWASLARADQTRAERILSAAVRFRARINALQEKLDKYEGCDRALMPPPRTGADAVTQLIEERRVTARLTDQVRKQEEQLAILQKANEAKYWRLARRAAAVADRPLALKAAS